MSGTVLAVVAQGSKRLALGDRFYDYGAWSVPYRLGRPPGDGARHRTPLPARPRSVSG